MNPNSSNICIRYSVWVIEEKYTHNLPIYLLYIIYNKIGANWCINPKRVKDDSVYLSESITIPPESGMVCQGWAHPAKDAGLFTLESASSLEVMVWRRPVV